MVHVGYLHGKEWSSALNMPNSFAALHANITADGTRGVEKSNQKFAVGILNGCWQAYTLVRDCMDPGGVLPRAVVRPGSAAMRTIADVYTTFNTRADTRRAESSEKGCKSTQLPRSRPAGEQQPGDRGSGDCPRSVCCRVSFLMLKHPHSGRLRA
jgi:hypothetical protein